jgi:hypothetical protein
MQVDVIGLPVPVLDEQTEMGGIPANYVSARGVPPRRHPRAPWPFAYARTLPGYPTYSDDVRDDRRTGSSDIEKRAEELSMLVLVLPVRAGRRSGRYVVQRSRTRALLSPS